MAKQQNPALRRLHTIAQQLVTYFNEELDSKNHIFLHFTDGNDDYTAITIGNVSLRVRTPRNPALVPFSVAPTFYGISLELPEILTHLKWMLQKLVLKQDMFLIGPPGPYRRWLTMRFCELTKREVEYVALSGDTSESDLKQRREILKYVRWSSSKGVHL
jgi:hypothetical protein